MDRLQAVEDAIADLIYDERVTKEGAGYRVVNIEGGEFLVLPVGNSGDGAVFFGSSTPDNPRPWNGLQGSTSSDVAHAVYWAMR
jgi:hypothetical protein